MISPTPPPRLSGIARPATKSAITPPAIPPNTVDSATPLPPRRLAPCTPPVSSPAANSPSMAVRQSIDDDAAHHEMRGGPDFHRPPREVATEVTTAAHHATEVALHDGGAE